MPAPLRLIIATRGSNLALRQASFVKEALESRRGDAVAVDLLVVKTKGDIILDVPLTKVGGKGLFVKEIEEAVLAGRADMAVHSLKDVPMETAAGLCLGVIMERGDPADVFLSHKYPNLTALPQGATLGTSSLRREAQSLALRPDLRVAPLRGNVETRLRKLAEGEFDAIILAAAGLERLALSAPYSERLTPESFLPAAGQGALGIEFCEAREDLRELLTFLEHRPTRLCVEAERGFLAGLNGDCRTPIAAHAKLNSSGDIELSGLVASRDGAEVIRQSLAGPGHSARGLGLALAERLKAAGADKILASLNSEID